MTKGSKVVITNMRQDGNKLTVSENQLRFNREYAIKCEAVGAKARGEATHRFKTVEKASDIKLLVEPDTIGVAETTMFTLTATKQANEDLHCKFFLEVPGSKDIRLDDESRPAVYNKQSEVVETTLKKSVDKPGSQTVKVMAFCSSLDLTAQYVKSESIFLKPKPVEDEAYESIVDEATVGSEQAGKAAEDEIDPAGLLIFASDMNDEQKVSLFTDLTEKLFLKATAGSDAADLAKASQELLDLVPAAAFQTAEAKTRVYTQMANIVKTQLDSEGVDSSEANSLDAATLKMLTEQVSTLVEVLPRSQTNLMKALKVGLLRSALSGAAGEEQTYSTAAFVSKQVRAVRDATDKKTLAHLELASDASSASVTIPDAAMFADKSDIVLQAVLYQDRLTDFAGYKPTVIDIDMYQGGQEESGAPQLKPIRVADLEEEIHVKLPAVAGRDLACAFFNEAASDWEALTCENEPAQEAGFVTCCTDHLTKFALVPAEYFSAVQDAPEQKQPSESGKPVAET